MTSIIRTFMNGQEIPRAQVLAWEQQRALAVLKKLGVKPAAQDLPTLHRQLLARKAELGPEGLLHRLRWELAISDRAAALTAWLSRGARRYSVIELLVAQGSAEQFASWYEAAARRNNQAAMLGATPDHFVLRTDANDVMDVVETNGGSPLAARFFIDMHDLSSLRSPIDPAFPVRLVGVARSSNGTAIGGVRHQFRNEGSGFRARLTVEFPALMLPSVLSGHQWHLASEFANWVEMALAAG